MDIEFFLIFSQFFISPTLAKPRMRSKLKRREYLHSEYYHGCDNIEIFIYIFCKLIFHRECSI
jgi:hypothetical protein